VRGTGELTAHRPSRSSWGDARNGYPRPALPVLQPRSHRAIGRNYREANGPRRDLRPCLTCGTPSRGSRCPRHQREWERARGQRRQGEGKAPRGFFDDPAQSSFLSPMRSEGNVSHFCCRGCFRDLPGAAPTWSLPRLRARVLPRAPQAPWQHDPARPRPCPPAAAQGKSWPRRGSAGSAASLRPPTTRW
jgi:hypothetical protein